MTAMAPLVLGPGHRGDLALVGGKAAGLQRLRALRLPVPRWITVTTRAADLVLAPFQERLTAHAADPAAIEAIVAAAPWPARLRAALARGLARLHAHAGLAVRSSVLGEDGMEASHAGQFVTLLNVAPGAAEAAVRACWCGAWASHAAVYRRRRGAGDTWPRIAVIVQEMAASEVAGIAFTADPRTGAPAHVVAAGYGLASGVVSDQVEADLFVRARGSDTWVRHVVRKTHAAHAGNGPTGTTIVSVPDTLRDRPALTDEALTRLCTLLEHIDPHGRSPMDVEWALDAAGRPAILQARPLTALPEGALGVWDDSNIGENFPGLTLPLTASYVRSLYARLFRRALHEAGVPPRRLSALDPALERLLELVRGRLYLNVTNYYGLFTAVPGFGWMTGPWEKALGIVGGEALRHALHASDRRFSIRAAVRTGTRLLRRFRGLDDEFARFRTQCDAFLEQWRGVAFHERPVCDVPALAARMQRDFVDLWTIHIFNDLLLFVCHAALERLLGERALDRRLLAGIPDAGSLAPLRSLLALVRVARAHPGIESLLTGPLPPEDVWRRVHELAGADDFRVLAAAHLREFGDRTGQELKLEVPTLGDAPWELVALLRGCWRAAPLEDAAAGEAADRVRAEAALRRRLAGRPVSLRLATMLLGHVRRGVAAREYMSLARARAFGVLRRLVRAAGQALAADGTLCRADDVFYLTIEELGDLARDRSRAGRCRSVVRHRREAYDRFGQEQLPHRLVCRGSVHRYDWPMPDDGPSAETGRLRGIPSSPGVVRGRAHVVARPSPQERVDGEILVAPATEPSWMFLMYAARGVIVERGSALSHAAIIGRELGIPTVIGVPGATTTIRTGDWVELNGVTGEVRILTDTEAHSTRA